MMLNTWRKKKKKSVDVPELIARPDPTRHPAAELPEETPTVQLSRQQLHPSAEKKNMDFVIKLVFFSKPILTC